MGQMYDLSKEIDFNNLTYYFKSKCITPISSIGFRGPLHLYKNIFNGDTNIEKAEKHQEQFKFDFK